MNRIIWKSRIHCLRILKSSPCRTMPFHNVRHTLEVFRNVKLICASEGIPKEDVETLLIAALFHDTGNSIRFKEHEALSASLAISFLEVQGYTPFKIRKVERYIKATKLPHQPKDYGEEVMADADLFHLGTAKFWERSEMLRTELSQFRGINYTDVAWNLENLSFLRDHTFFTTYGQCILDPVKRLNIKKLERTIAKDDFFKN
ncbi:MAG: HD domain-containing protein [Flavobacteriaceae bacterium]